MATQEALLSEVMVARQPVVDQGLDVVGYELLFNDATDGGATVGDATVGDATVGDATDFDATDGGATVAGDDLRGIASLLIDGLPAAHLQLLRELAQGEVDLGRVEELIRSDLTLTDRFLRMVDVVCGWRAVESVRHGLVMMGTLRLHRWVSLLLLSSVESKVSGELLMSASTRARYCEELQQRRARSSGLEPFTLGMFSVLGADGLVDAALLADLPVSDAVRSALLGQPGDLRELIDIAIAAERGDWSRLVTLGRGLGLQPRELAQAHHEALRWSVQAKLAAAPGG